MRTMLAFNPISVASNSDMLATCPTNKDDVILVDDVPKTR